MGESLGFLLDGLAVAMQPENLLFAFMGCLLGTMVGVLPGIGPTAATAILIPTTFTLEPTPAIIMLSAIYYGTQYGGTITAVLFNTPGEGSAAVTCIDGYEMAKKGRAGPALAMAAIGSLIGGFLSTMALVFVSLPVAALALKFGPPEFFALLVMSLSLVAALAGKSLVRGLISATIGLLIAMVGIDPVAGLPRFTFGQANLLDGVSFIPLVMGLFGIGEILLNIEDPERRVVEAKFSSLAPTFKDFRQSIFPMLRGAAIGFFSGILPGLSSSSATFMSYVAEKKVSKTPEKFGEGAIEGVAGPETANNASATAAFLPLFTLGIPTSGVLAVLMGAFMMNGLIPGPLLMEEHGDIVWAIIASMFIGNVMLLILNLPLIPIWVAVLKIPYSILFTVILCLTIIGTYSLANSVFDIGILITFGIVGYIFKKLDFPLVPMALTMILGPLTERGLRQSLEMSQGDFMIFLVRPISAVLLAFAALFLIGSVLQAVSQIKGGVEEEA